MKDLYATTLLSGFSGGALRLVEAAAVVVAIIVREQEDWNLFV
jgi:hypothetical protein